MKKLDKPINFGQIIAHKLQMDDPNLASHLDNLKGSDAVEYVLEALLRKGNQHTIYSALQLIKKGRK